MLFSLFATALRISLGAFSFPNLEKFDYNLLNTFLVTGVNAATSEPEVAALKMFLLESLHLFIQSIKWFIYINRPVYFILPTYKIIAFRYATILAFDVKVERDAQELADSLGVKIFQADIIYHLFDKFMAYREELKQKKRDEFKHIAVFPCKLRILPQFVFNSRDPIVCGVIVEAGIIKEGTPICVPSKEVCV